MADAKLAEAYVEIVGRLDKLDGDLSKGESAVRGWASRVKSLAVAYLSIQGIQVLGGQLMEMTAAAVDLQETTNKTNEVFKESTGVVTGFADEMAAKYGLVKQATLDAASNLGLVAMGAGMGRAEAAAMSVQLARLAADASSFYNVPVADALEKIRAGLVGESEPLRAFGVMLDEARVKEEALRLGLVKSGEELDNQAKIAARASLIAQGLATAQGDLERTADGLANQQRKLAGEIANFRAELGEHLMPVLGSAIELFKELFAGQGQAAESGVAAAASWAKAWIDGIRAVWSDWSMLNPFMSDESRQAKLAPLLGTDRPTAPATPAPATPASPTDLVGGMDAGAFAASRHEQLIAMYEREYERKRGAQLAERMAGEMAGEKGGVNASLQETRFQSRNFSDARSAWQSMQSDALGGNIPKQQLDEARKLNDTIRNVEQDLKRFLEQSGGSKSAIMTGPA